MIRGSNTKTHSTILGIQVNAEYCGEASLRQVSEKVQLPVSTWIHKKSLHVCILRKARDNRHKIKLYWGSFLN